MTNCEHYENGCKLGLHGGKPLAGNCEACLAAHENNQEYATALFAAYERSHPPNVLKVSGCCDSALNPPTV
jgi:hypothetical protein